ncbi:MAG: acetoacetate--CoA ligase, partial [Dehalococcoidales bacterium]
MKTPLWQPGEERKKQANMTGFIRFVNRKYGLGLDGYDELYDWSVAEIADFWAAMWEFAGIRASRPYDRVVDDLGKFPGAKWFEGARLNFAENLLRYRDDRTAIIFRGETQKSERMTYAELYRAVSRLARSLRASGLQPGDRVAAYLPNLKETAIAMLAATSIGAVWSSCATDLGAQATLDRLSQIEPKILFVADGYYYKGKAFDSLAKAAEVAQGMPSLEKIIVVSYLGGTPDISALPKAVFYDRFISREENPELHFEQLPFDHPVYIMFSSGTTGQPKCLVQGAGGVLINHLKEIILHTNLKPEDTILYVTTCSWMMWNWLLSSLAVGAALVLYDGNPNYPGPGALWQLAQEEKITIFGTSASYINYLMSQDFRPGDNYDLSCLREISQTGSALSTAGFEFVYRAIKTDRQPPAHRPRLKRLAADETKESP